MMGTFTKSFGSCGGYIAASKRRHDKSLHTVLKQLSSEELSRNSVDVSGDRIGRLTMHLLSQHGFYPLYPPSISVPMDLSVAPEALDIPSTPDVLLLHSDVAPFVKLRICILQKMLVLSYESNREGTVSCMCVNPGRHGRELS